MKLSLSAIVYPVAVTTIPSATSLLLNITDVGLFNTKSSPVTSPSKVPILLNVAVVVPSYVLLFAVIAEIVKSFLFIVSFPSVFPLDEIVKNCCVKVPDYIVKSLNEH